MRLVLTCEKLELFQDFPLVRVLPDLLYIFGYEGWLVMSFTHFNLGFSHEEAFSLFHRVVFYENVLA